MSDIGSDDLDEEKGQDLGVGSALYMYTFSYKYLLNGLHNN